MSFTYAYNPAGQIVSRTSSNEAYTFSGEASGTTSTPANGLNQLASRNGATIGHDAKGNTLNDPSVGYGYGYNSENELTSAGSASLVYDPLGRLSQAGSNRYLHDGTDRVGEYDSFGSLLNRYVHGPSIDEPLFEYDASGNRRALLADERGSIIAAASSSGNVTYVGRYDDYGNVQSYASRFGFTGLAVEEMTELHYAGNDGGTVTHFGHAHKKDHLADGEVAQVQGGTPRRANAPP